jgi:hypothetical protein
MDLKQTKLTKTEWNNTEVPVSTDEMRILHLIREGFHDVNTKSNINQSMFQVVKIEVTPENESYLYKSYFEKDITTTIKKYGDNIVSYIPQLVQIKQPKKVDMIRLQNMDATIETRRNIIFEYVLLDLAHSILKSITNETSKYAMALYTAFQLKKCTIPNVNKYVLEFVDKVIQIANDMTSITSVIHRAYEFIEKNPTLLKYEDATLFQHQKQLFTIFKQKPTTPKLVLYIAPTGTGKTLSPIGLSENFRVIFICVSRHVGLALAKSAISMEKKIAFAFGCDTASDIRLHYFASASHIKNTRTGGIWKVDNSVGTKVEIMICDVQSYLTAMHYMLAFNPEENIVTYWDEPTITMDYEHHELHAKIHQNWNENKISKMVLSCATLPQEADIMETICDFRMRFDCADIHTISSYDFKKTIAVLNKDGMCVLPHLLYGNYADLAKCIRHCESNMTLLRYFDLSEIVRYIKYVIKHGILDPDYDIDKYFTSIADITMKSLKIYYLESLKHLDREKWAEAHTYLKTTQKLKFASAGGIKLTTSDAHTLTDGPTIFLADDVEKIGKVYIQNSNIPANVLNNIMERIEVNNDLQEKITKQQQLLDDKLGVSKDDDVEKNTDNKNARREKYDPEISKIVAGLDKLREQIKSANLEAKYIPNTKEHQKVWTTVPVENAFVPRIEESTVREIMELDVSNSMKILLLLGIGTFATNPNTQYMEIMKRLAYEQRLFLCIASSDYIYGTNYSFCHGFIGKDLTHMTQQKIIQAMGRIGRNKVQNEYTIRFRDDEIMMRLFMPVTHNLEAINMSRLFSIVGGTIGSPLPPPLCE